jgi:hypothetical protein
MSWVPVAQDPRCAAQTCNRTTGQARHRQSAHKASRKDKRIGAHVCAACVLDCCGSKLLTILLAVSTTEGMPVIRGRNRSWMSHTKSAVCCGSSLPRRATDPAMLMTLCAGWRSFSSLTDCWYRHAKPTIGNIAVCAQHQALGRGRLAVAWSRAP